MNSKLKIPSCYYCHAEVPTYEGRMEVSVICGGLPGAPRYFCDEDCHNDYMEEFGHLDSLTRQFTTANTFRDLVEGAAQNYRPSLPCTGRLANQRKRLADAYDAAQAKRGDPRRAYRG